MNPQSTLKDLFCFLLQVPSIEGTVLEARIDAVTQSNNAGYTYKLKSKSDSLSRNRGMYSDEQIEQMKVAMKNYLLFFGYTNDPSGQENPTEFFKIENLNEKEPLFAAFRKQNQIILNEL